MSATMPTGDPSWASGYDYLDRQPQNYVIPTPGWGVGRCLKCGRLLGTHEYHLCPATQTYPWQPMPYPVYPPPMPAPVKTTITTTFTPNRKSRPDGEAMRAEDV